LRAIGKPKAYRYVLRRRRKVQSWDPVIDFCSIYTATEILEELPKTATNDKVCCSRIPKEACSVKILNIIICLVFLICGFTKAGAQQAAEQRSPLTEPAIAFDANGANAIEARLLTTVLNGSPDSPVANIRMVLKNNSPTFYTYVSGWATFYDAGGVRCGEGLFKADALAPGESVETDAPGLRLRCSPVSWRIVATNLLMRSKEMAPAGPAPAAALEPAVVERPAPVNFIISIDGEEHPIQVNNPIVLKLGNRDRKIVLRPIP
jgi:hypothetical protein